MTLLRFLNPLLFLVDAALFVVVARVIFQEKSIVWGTTVQRQLN